MCTYMYLCFLPSAWGSIPPWVMWIWKSSDRISINILTLRWLMLVNWAWHAWTLSPTLHLCKCNWFLFDGHLKVDGASLLLFLADGTLGSHLVHLQLYWGINNLTINWQEDGWSISLQVLHNWHWYPRVRLLCVRGKHNSLLMTWFTCRS